MIITDMWLLYLSGETLPLSVPMTDSQTAQIAGGMYNTLRTSYIRIFISFSFILRGWSSFSKFSFLLHLKNHHSKPVNLKFQIKQSSCFEYEAILYIAVALTLPYRVSLIMVPITCHTFSLLPSKWNTFQLWNLPWVMSKIWAYLWYQNLKRDGKKLDWSL